MGAERGIAASPSVPPPHITYGPPQPQAGLLTASDYDDLLNPELYAAYVNRSGDLGQEVRDLPRVDTMRVVTVKVNDRSVVQAYEELRELFMGARRS